MSFKRKIINDNYIIRVFNSVGLGGVIDLYKEAESFSIEGTLSIDIYKILTDDELILFGKNVVEETILQRIHSELGIIDIKK